ncbi:MAG: Methylamine utilization protein MauE [Syntrophaceae bacterium PtaU1.Bin231]|nr:MAG: Methylamine utilization protein MauE [Syntrophaceae bacterium PtaU1.Bin231]HOG16244.1 MauE/DoxX family redox-associated membrane protein [Syntrophales bacterium]
MTTPLKKMAASLWLYRFVRIGLAFLFLYGGIVKLIDPKAFARILSAYGLVPEPLLPVVAIGLPALEALAGLALLFDIRGGLAIITGLLGLFVAVLGYGILKDLDVDCGCFGAADLSRQDALRQAFYRDLALIFFVVPFLYLSRRIRVCRPVPYRRRAEK